MHDDGPSLSPAPRRREDFVTAYRRALEDQLDADATQRSGIEVVYDAMHGSGVGVLDAVLESAGATLRRLRTEPDPNFGGTSPDPIAQNLTQLALEVRAVGRLALGLATDGDEDRFGVVDRTGRVLTETLIVALWIGHLATTGPLRRGVAITNGTGSLVEQVAANHGLSVERHPFGFEHSSSAIEAQRVDVAGQESGGFAQASMGRDKDGLAGGLPAGESRGDLGRASRGADRTTRVSLWRLRLWTHRNGKKSRSRSRPRAALKCATRAGSRSSRASRVLCRIAARPRTRRVPGPAAIGNGGVAARVCGSQDGGCLGERLSRGIRMLERTAEGR